MDAQPAAAFGLASCRLVTLIVEFVEKGGEIDFVIPEDEEEDEDISEREESAHRTRNELRAMFKEVRALERKIHQLEHKDPNK